MVWRACFPVIAGLTTGTGLLLIRSQFKPLLGLHHAGAWSQWHWLPIATATAAFGIARYAPRIFPRLPGPIAGLLGGTALFQIGLHYAGPRPIPEHWVIGALPGPAQFHLATDSLAAWPNLPWPLILHAAFALAVLCSLNTLLTSVLADTTTGLRHNSRRELLAQSVGQIVTGLAGGMAGSASVGGTVTAVRAGARRWAAPTASGILLLLLLFSGPVGQWLPTSALAGIIIASALNLLETDIVAWARRRRTRLDAAVALLVTGVTVGYDLMSAVLVGLAIAILLFIREQSQVPVIHRRLTAIERPSVRQRLAEQVELLARHGDRIVMYQLRGTLFFAKTDQLFEEMLPDLDRPAWVILHLRRVIQIDLSSVRLLQQIAARLEAHGGERLFAAGDLGSELYLVLRGRVDIRLPAAAYRFKRLAIHGPGTVFGEIAFLDPGPRAAEAVAIKPSELLALSRTDFNQLRNDQPDAAIALLLALGRLQSRTLRWSAKEIQRLIQW